MASDQPTHRSYTGSIIDAGHRFGSTFTNTGSALLQRMKAVHKGENSGDEPFADCDQLNYTGEDITCWTVIFKIRRTVWMRKSLWLACLKMSVLAWVTGILTVFLVSDPSKMNLGGFTQLATLLSVFVSLTVSFFIYDSIRRWYAAADGFMNLFDAARSLQMDLLALGVNDQKIDAMMRYGVLSGWLLNMELAIEASPQDKKAELTEQMWHILKNDKEKGAPFGMPGLLTDEEKIALENIGDPAATIWLWVGMIIGQMAAEGEVPPMQSPTYGRLQGQTSAAVTAIRKVRFAISIEAPFVYVQMLAALVHMHNMVNAIAFGITAGGTAGMLYIREASSFHEVPREAASTDELMNDIQNLLVSFFLSVVGPLIYQGLLEVCVAVAKPFGSKDGAVPTKNLLNVLQDDLKNAKLMTSMMPYGWSQAHFKTPV